jgi:CheY-like chemotaxis protein
VLVVDDIEPVRDLVCEVLGYGGYHTLAAASGTEAIELAKSHDGKIEMVVSDCNLPGMDGTAVFRALKDFHPEIRALFISGNHDSMDASPSEFAPKDFLLKPFTSSELLKKVKQVLAKQ